WPPPKSPEAISTLSTQASAPRELQDGNRLFLRVGIVSGFRIAHSRLTAPLAVQAVHFSKLFRRFGFSSRALPVQCKQIVNFGALGRLLRRLLQKSDALVYLSGFRQHAAKRHVGFEVRRIQLARFSQ